MLELNKLVSKWRIWINRDKTFSKEELDELENHLLEEIEDLQTSEGLSEEEAFQKAVTMIGGREMLNNEFNKVRPFSFMHIIRWIQKYALYFIGVSILIIIFLALDSWFSNRFFVTETKKDYTYGIPIYRITGNNEISGLNVKYKWETLKLSIPDNFQWGTINKPMPTKPKYWGKWSFYKFYVVIDDKNQLWLDKDNNFQDSTCLLTSLNQSSFASPSWFMDEKTNLSKYKEYPNKIGFSIRKDESNENNTFGPFQLNSIISMDMSNNSDSIFSKESLPKIQNCFIQIILLNNEPYLYWSEIYTTQKPLHLLSPTKGYGDFKWNKFSLGTVKFLNKIFNKKGSYNYDKSGRFEFVAYQDYK